MEDERGGEEKKKNDFIRLLETRHAKRAFRRDRPVPSELVELVLTAAANGTPSTQNTQPWGVTVVQGQDVDALRTLLLAKFDRDETDTPEYQNRPVDPTLPEFDAAIARYGQELFARRGIARADAEARRTHARENYTFFNANTLLLVHVPERAVAGTFVDVGAYIQSVMLGLLSYDIGSCPQYALTRFARTLHETRSSGDGLPLLPDGRILVCGMSVGYLDSEADINTFAPARKAPSSFIRFTSDHTVRP